MHVRVEGGAANRDAVVYSLREPAIPGLEEANAKAREKGGAGGGGGGGGGAALGKRKQART